MTALNQYSCIPQSLQMFNRIDSNLLDAHLSQLLAAASNNKDGKANESKELTHRALEVASVRHGRNEVEQYSNTIHRVLLMAPDDSIDDGVIRSVVRHLRAGEATRYSSMRDTGSDKDDMLFS